MDQGSPIPTIAAGDHKGYIEYALDRARLSPPASAKFCVGAVLVDANANAIISTGYSLELARDSLGDPGSTHTDPRDILNRTVVVVA